MGVRDLHSVKPEFLLDKQGFVSWWHTEIERGRENGIAAFVHEEPKLFYEKLTHHHDIVSSEAWIQIIFQVNLGCWCNYC
jgi:hypothetical protein